MTTSPPDDLILQYLAGKLRGVDADVIRRYLDATPARRGITAALHEAMYRDALTGTPPDARLSLAELMARLPEGRDRGAIRERRGLSGEASAKRISRWLVKTRTLPLGKRPLRWWILPAGVAVLSVGVIIHAGFLNLASNPRKDHVVRAYATARGQRASFTLDDGTRVTLAPQTTVRLSAFTPASRTVLLDGEAYFDVGHSGGAPFIVRTGAVTTRVLGTAFLVKRYTGDSRTRVIVVNGKVSLTSVAAPKTSLTIVGGRGADMTDSGTTVDIRDNVTDRTGWVNGRLVFHDAPTTEVLAALTRWYGYEFRFTDSALAMRTLTMALSTHSSETALSTLKVILNADMTFDHNVVTITPRRTHALPSPDRRNTRDGLTSRTREVGR